MHHSVAIVYRSYEHDPNVSHAGLGICAINTSKTLNQNRIECDFWPVKNAPELEARIEAKKDLTHVMIQAPWVPTHILAKIAAKYRHIQFAVNCHSNVGFLQTEPQAVTLMLDLLSLEQTTSNIHCAGNSKPFADWIMDAYQAHCTLLPNLYYLDAHAHTPRPIWNGGLLRIGIFGAPRPQKNIMTGVAGAIQIAQMLKAHTEIWVNAGRMESHGKTILEAARRAIARNPLCVYREFDWAPWPEFRRFVGSMNLLIQASYTESFNQVTADGIAMGVPTAASAAITWVPNYWKAEVDSAESIAHTGRLLLINHKAASDGLNALKKHNEWGVIRWREYLSQKAFLN